MVFVLVRRGAMAALALSLLVSATPALAGAAEGLAAFQDGHFSEAVVVWQQAASEGDAASALYLGVMCDTGFGVPQSAPDALAWYRQAGERGNVTGMVNTAIMLDAGRGTAAQPAEATQWYRRAAQAGSGRAAYNLGLLYQDGIGVPPDRGAAVRFFREAVADGVVEGRAKLRQLGVREANRVGALRQDPAMTDFERAQRTLLARGPGAETQAAALFRKAAEGGNALAAYNLGYCYEHGIGVPTDVALAREWYRRSASLTRDPAVRAIALKGENASDGGAPQR